MTDTSQTDRELLARWDEALAARESRAHPDFHWTIKLLVWFLLALGPWFLGIAVLNWVGVL